MNALPTPTANDELDPSLAALLRGSDPCGAEHEGAPARSRAHTAAIPDGDHVPVFSQRPSPVAPGTARGAAMAQETGRHPRTRNHRRAAAILAVAAAGAIVAGVGVLGPWGNAPQPAAPPAVAPTPAPSETYFNPDDNARLAAFSEAGGVRITGWLRPALPSDAPAARSTGWLLQPFAVSGQGDSLFQATDPWLPIALDSSDAAAPGEEAREGILVVVASTDAKPGLVTPGPGPYGVMVSDPARLAAGSVGGARSLKTLGGTYLQRPDVEYNGAVLTRFATFKMAYAHTGKPSGTTERFKATAVHSHTGAQARSCIAASTRQGAKILSFPEGSTASASIAEFAGPEDPVAGYPLRFMPRDGWLGEGDDSTFILDTGDTPTADFAGFPTARNATCGEYSGEVVLFRAVAKQPLGLSG
ncbi:hypothetical protein DQ353_13130 [Arthrobacter sp. AQ5-05]|uniref:hypothetical protein n=1 Tax=Arthrobacter sp. AQ5-05 TaxID=2184581 RepID=UPI000DCBC1F0|nr:hypothetical protein [Arthrobacter sp. AQ5-05]RAX48862.1 hypothetical protein DQ353_13130 [Arthrobacter sp. AQ5-05]